MMMDSMIAALGPGDTLYVNRGMRTYTTRYEIDEYNHGILKKSYQGIEVISLHGRKSGNCFVVEAVCKAGKE